MSSIVRTEGSIDTCTDILKAKLSDYAETGEIIDISEWVQLCGALPRLQVSPD